MPTTNPSVPGSPQTAKTSRPSFSLSIPKKFRYLLYPILILCLILLSLSLFVAPQIETVPKLRQEIKASQDKEAILTAKLTQLQNLSEADLTANSRILTSALPSEKAIAPSILILSSLAGKNSLQITSLKLTPGLISTESAEVKTASPTSSDDLRIDLTLAGLTSSLETFLSQIDRTTPLITIDEISLTYPDSLDLKVNSAWSPLPTQLPPLESPLPALTDADEATINLVKDFSSATIPIAVPGSQTSGKTNPFTP